MHWKDLHNHKSLAPLPGDHWFGHSLLIGDIQFLTNICCQSVCAGYTGTNSRNYVSPKQLGSALQSGHSILSTPKILGAFDKPCSVHVRAGFVSHMHDWHLGGFSPVPKNEHIGLPLVLEANQSGNIYHQAQDSQTPVALAPTFTVIPAVHLLLLEAGKNAVTKLNEPFHSL